MPLMSTCLARLGSRYSLILDPVRREVHYGALGLMCQAAAELVAGVDDGRGRFSTLPFSKEGQDFHNLDQQLTMTSVLHEGNCVSNGVKLRTEIVAPFWPQDEPTSLVPAYIVKFRVSRLEKVRWTSADRHARRKGVLRFGLKLPGVRPVGREGMVRLSYEVSAGERMKTGEGGTEQDHGRGGRRTPTSGRSTDLLVPLAGEWRVRRGMLEAAFDVSAPGAEQEFAVAMCCYCGDALFERFGRAMRLKYTSMWPDVRALAEFLKAHWRRLCDKSRDFDELFSSSALPAAARDLTALSFQSYLMNTMWTVGDAPAEWFSVWEGSCWFNSTVDVTYNEAMFYFACWPRLMELIFEEWSHHANDAEADRKRREAVSDDDLFGARPEDFQFPGAILQHDMGAGWTANGQSYHHLMPVEENCNFLLLLYAHGVWWGRQKLFATYRELNRRLVEYLLWTDSTGNGFPDRGTANTIDDATPAVQYGRDNVYLGIKRLAALHAAGRMLDAVGEAALARRCRREVRKAAHSLDAGWLGDHFAVCLDRSAKGLVDCWTGRPLPYRVLPGWDAYSLYTTNGLLYLLMIDDLPPGIRRDRLRHDAVSACRASMTTYGCGHSSMDQANMWVSMNVWRDCAAGYLGEDMLTNCERYWNQQLFGNGLGAEKPNCFTETSLTNNLVWYPRGAATFGLLMSGAGLVMDGASRTASVGALAAGRWPLLPLANWRKGKVPAVIGERAGGKTSARVEGPTGRFKVEIRRKDRR